MIIWNNIFKNKYNSLAHNEKKKNYTFKFFIVCNWVDIIIYAVTFSQEYKHLYKHTVASSDPVAKASPLG